MRDPFLRRGIHWAQVGCPSLDLRLVGGRPTDEGGVPQVFIREGCAGFRLPEFALASVHVRQEGAQDLDADFPDGRAVLVPDPFGVGAGLREGDLGVPRFVGIACPGWQQAVSSFRFASAVVLRGAVENARGALDRNDVRVRFLQSVEGVRDGAGVAGDGAGAAFELASALGLGPDDLAKASAQQFAQAGEGGLPLILRCFEMVFVDRSGQGQSVGSVHPAIPFPRTFHAPLERKTRRSARASSGRSGRRIPAWRYNRGAARLIA